MTPSFDTSLHLRRAREGDPESLGWIVARLSPLLLAQARQRIGPHLARHCEPLDVVQDVWAIALPRLFELEPRDDRATPVVLRFLATTLLQHVNNLARKHIRRRLRGGEGGGEGEQDRIASLPDTTRGIVTRAAQGEASSLLLRAIEELPARDREVVVLRGIEQLSSSEVAELVGDTPNAVSLRYNRALAGLRAKLGESVLDDLQD